MTGVTGTSQTARATKEYDPPRRQQAPRGLAPVMDMASDAALLAFAVWTVLYHGGLLLGLSVTPLFVVWLLTLPLAVGFAWKWLPPVASEETTGPGFRRRHGLLILVSLVLAGTATAVVAFERKMWIACVGAATVSALVLLGLVTATSTLPWGQARWAGRVEARSRRGLRLDLSSWAVLAVSVALPCASLFFLRADGDDVYYVNRAVWIADHGTLATRDTIFSDQVLAPPASATVPLPSIEALQGAVARLLPIEPGSVVYLVTPLVAGMLAIWVMWRLIRLWAPRRHLLAMATGLVYLALTGASGASFGTFHLLRIWQGKVVLVALLVPLLYVHVTRWLERRNAPHAVMLVAGGAAAVGLSTTALFVVPLMAAASALVPAVRRSWGTAAGLMLPAAYPVGAALAVKMLASTVSTDDKFLDASTSFGWIFGAPGPAAVGLLALLVTGWYLRPAGAVVVTGIAAVTVVLLLPGTLEMMRAVSGAGPVLWRALWVAPVPVLVGLLASVPMPTSWPRAASLLPAAALSGVLVQTGVPVWSPANASVTLHHRPVWKMDGRALKDARGVAEVARRGDIVLAPAAVMRGLAIVTTEVHPVNPRDFYSTALAESLSAREDRRILTAFERDAGAASTQRVRQALSELDVRTACVRGSDERARATLEQAGFDHPRAVNTLVCVRRS